MRAIIEAQILPGVFIVGLAMTLIGLGGGA